MLAAAVGIALATAAIGLLAGAVPVLSLGVLYVLPVLWVATRWGVGLGIATAVASMLAYNWFHLPPIHRFTLVDNRHWSAVGVLLVVAVVSARIAEAGRREARQAGLARRETELVGELARCVLTARRVDDALPEAARLLSAYVGVRVTLVLGDGALGRTSPETAIGLDGPHGTIGAVLLEHEVGDPAIDGALRQRIAPALAAALAAGSERERLAAAGVEAETLRRSDEVKTTLLRTVSHDLRTPLTQISAAAAALASPSLEESERVELAGGIEEGAERLAAMIEKLLDMSRLEVGAASPRTDLVPLDDLVRDALEAVGSDAGRVTLEVEDPPPSVRADPAQVVRILVNLLENALLHGRGHGPGGDRVLVRVARRRGRAVVRIVDRGPGVPDATQAMVFRPFHRNPPAGGAQGTGSGLGLAIARGFAEANDGTVRVESYPGQGAAFVLELPPGETADDAGAAGAAGADDRGTVEATRAIDADADRTTNGADDGPEGEQR